MNHFKPKYLHFTFSLYDYDLDIKSPETHKKDHAAIDIPLSSDLPAGVLYLTSNSFEKR